MSVAAYARETTAWKAGRRLVDDVNEMFSELYEYRELFLTLVQRDVTVRYRKTVLGVGWALFTPIINMVVFTVIFHRVAKIETDVPYPIFLYCGLMPWTLFSSSLKSAIGSLVANRNLIAKVYFARELMPFSSITAALVDFLISSSLLVLLMIYYGIAPRGTVWLVPVLVLIQVVFAAGLGLALSMANLWFRDVKYFFDVVLQLWMFATPVVYPVRRVGEPLYTILQFNPMTPIIEAYRAVILQGTLPPALPLVTAAITSITVFAVSWLWFHRSEYTFAENV
jgi:homopolymeric O-antigen transport system permease protein